MLCPTRLLRIAVAAAFGAVLLAPPPDARAQEPPPAQIAPEAAPPEAGDPPARVGRLARIEGTVSFRGPGAGQWEAATPNYPLTAGGALWTEKQARALLEVSSSRIALAGGTEFDLDALDAQTLSATEPQGEAYLSLRDLAPGETFTLRTPRGTVTFAEPGRYAVAAGDTQTPTTVTVLAGSAQMNGDSFGLLVRAGQTLSITGTDTYDASIGQAVRDPFLAAMLNERPPALPAQSAPPPASVAAMPGAEDLQAYGAWQATPQYGTVWYPTVSPGWVPYRDGHWAYVLPWGWTWIDDAPWGFAPFHYGRWVEIGDRWAWAPVYIAPGYPPPPFYAPVYAPALVSFVGFGVGIGFGASVGWVPLGWNEPFHPWYGCSPIYVRNINRRYVANVTNITNVTNVRTVTVNNFANRGALTIAPASAMAGSRPIGKLARTVPPQQFATLRAAALPPVRPTAATAGVTPAMARQLRLPAAPQGEPARPAAPGPATTPMAARALQRPLAPPLRGPIATGIAARPMAPRTNAPPALRTPEQTARPVIATPPRTHPGTNAPPALRAPEQTARPVTAAPPHPVAPPRPEMRTATPPPQHLPPQPHPEPQAQHPQPPPRPELQVQHPPPPPPQRQQPPPRPEPQARPQPQPRPAPERQPEPQRRCNPGQTC